MNSPLRVMAIQYQGDLYRFDFNRDGEPDYPHTYTSTRNGQAFTESGGAATFSQVLAEAFADIEEYGGCDWERIGEKEYKCLTHGGEAFGQRDLEPQEPCEEA